MAINISTQYKYTGKGPFDAKSLVKTYEELTSPQTWTVDGSTIAYNGMIVAVWLDKTEGQDYNGIYYLHDTNVTSTRQSPNVANPDNWHKISDTVDVSAIQATLDLHEERIAALETEKRVHIHGYRKMFPENGIPGHMYVATDEGRTYVFIDSAEGKKYLHIADRIDAEDTDGDPETPEVRVIYGGTAD